MAPGELPGFPGQQRRDMRVFGDRLGHDESVVFWLVVCFGGCHGRV
jgi:hypothetical protein